MVSPEKPETDTVKAAGPAPCAPDAAVSIEYDPAKYGRCVNGHALNPAGRCAWVNNHGWVIE